MNYTNYWTKHHVAIHHKGMQPLFLNTHQEKKKGLINIRGDRGVHHNATIVNQTEHKSCVRDLTSCQGVLESPYSLSPAGSKDQTGPGENPDRPNPNCRKGTEDPKTRDMTDTSTGKKPASSGQAMAQKRPLANYSNH